MRANNRENPATAALPQRNDANVDNTPSDELEQLTAIERSDPARARFDREIKRKKVLASGLHLV